MNELKGKLVYLGAPYGDYDPAVMLARMERVSEVSAQFIAAGIHSVSPLSNHYYIWDRDIPGNWKFWADYCLNLIRRCDEVVIVTIDGWIKSGGVQAEINIAKALNIPVHLIDPDGTNLRPYIGGQHVQI